MVLAFSARQSLDLPVQADALRLPDYLADEPRVVGALLCSDQLECLGERRYRYGVQQLQVFQLRFRPVVELVSTTGPGRLAIEAVDCRLDGIDNIDQSFVLTLSSLLEARPDRLVGQAVLGVSVERPAMLRLIPTKVLNSTGEALLARILRGIQARVCQQLLLDFASWCGQHPGAVVH
ncbi:MAG: DUF1997 domain-containing protein [Aphanocapsa feldmannii 277cI]|uniref:DUF1997 domain-containing protein n=1 Tax=Aphanocapsa feldmannii 277cI TaxID=2507554 RepID=A0A524RV72_9CHRO|nr:MAG: DUF1997 domain-containing protein [Aphanocapsa feldmannii 277cI]